jgi:hypothetical protein
VINTIAVTSSSKLVNRLKYNKHVETYWTENMLSVISLRWVWKNYTILTRVTELYTSYTVQYIKLKLWACVHMFGPYSSRMDSPICTKFCMLIPWDQQGTTGGSKLRKSMSSILGEGSSCSSETKHDRRTAPRPKLFVSKRRLQKQRPQRRRTILGSSSDKDDFCSSKTKHDIRTAPR